MRRAAVAAAASVLLAAAVAPARGADTASGGFQCNAEKIPIRGAVARWEPAKRELRVMFFKAPPSPETVAFWLKQAGSGGTAHDPSMGYFAVVTLKLVKDAPPRVDQAAIESCHFYVHCPTLQANLNRSIFTRRDMKKDFPTFEAALQREGRLRLNARGDEKMGMQSPTHITWDVRVDAPVVVK